MYNTLFRKGLVFAIICVFFGVAIAPSITGNIVNLYNDRKSLVLDNNDLVEITTRIYGLEKLKNCTIQLNQEEFKMFKVVFNEINQKIENTTSRDEAEIIFKDAVIELDKFGLFGEFSVEEIQKLVVRSNDSKTFKIIDSMFNNNLQKDEENTSYFSLLWMDVEVRRIFVGGKFVKTFLLLTTPILAGIYQSIIKSSISDEMKDKLIDILFDLTFHVFFLVNLPLIIPININYHIGFGDIDYQLDDGTYTYRPAIGEVRAYGLSDLKTWEGSLWGDLPNLPFYFYFAFRTNTMPIGVTGFTGINVEYQSGYENYYGTAITVKLHEGGTPDF